MPACCQREREPASSPTKQMLCCTLHQAALALRPSLPTVLLPDTSGLLVMPTSWELLFCGCISGVVVVVVVVMVFRWSGAKR